MEKAGCCRVCMQNIDILNASDIFHSVCTNSQSISERITYCTGLQFIKNDGLPSHICDMCLNDLIIAHKFKTTCLKTDEDFRNTTLKVEPKEEVYHYEDYNEIYTKNELKLEDTGFDARVSKDHIKGDETVKLQAKNKTAEEKLKCGKKLSGTGGIIKEKTSKNLKSNDIKQPKSDRLWCELCKELFTTKQDAMKHKKQHVKKKEFICEICGKVFPHRSSHYAHLRSHRPPLYGCDYCEYKAWYKQDLVKHLRIHSGLKQFQCEYCTASYYVSSNLKSHIRRCHTKVKNFTCPICSYKFFDKFKLKMHIDSHNDIKRHHCDVCGSNFSTSCYLKKHLLKRHGIETGKVKRGRQKVNEVISHVTTENRKDTIKL